MSSTTLFFPQPTVTQNALALCHQASPAALHKASVLNIEAFLKERDVNGTVLAGLAPIPTELMQDVVQDLSDRAGFNATQKRLFANNLQAISKELDTAVGQVLTGDTPESVVARMLSHVMKFGEKLKAAMPPDCQPDCQPALDILMSLMTDIDDPRATADRFRVFAELTEKQCPQPLNNKRPFTPARSSKPTMKPTTVTAVTDPTKSSAYQSIVSLGFETAEPVEILELYESLPLSDFIGASDARQNLRKDIDAHYAPENTRLANVIFEQLIAHHLTDEQKIELSQDMINLFNKMPGVRLFGERNAKAFCKHHLPEFNSKWIGYLVWDLEDPTKIHIRTPQTDEQRTKGKQRA